MLMKLTPRLDLFVDLFYPAQKISPPKLIFRIKLFPFNRKRGLELPIINGFNPSVAEIYQGQA
jgi:hypothetical protein